MNEVPPPIDSPPPDYNTAVNGPQNPIGKGAGDITNTSVAESFIIRPDPESFIINTRTLFMERPLSSSPPNIRLSFRFPLPLMSFPPFFFRIAAASAAVNSPPPSSFQNFLSSFCGQWGSDSEEFYRLDSEELKKCLLRMLINRVVKS